MSEPLMPMIEIGQMITELGADSLYQCMQCGLCSGLCPWPKVGAPLNTRRLIRMGQMGLEGYESEDFLYACTTCRLCQNNCPRGVKIIDVIRLMRSMIAESGAIPGSLRPILGSVHSKGNPWSEDREKRTAWQAGLDVPVFDGSQEYFLFVCCTSCFDARSQKIAKTVVELLNKAGVSYGVIGNEESCCGESVRKMGGEEQFAALAEKNMKLWAEKGVKKIIVTSPHCLTTFTVDYPEMGAELEEVVHIGVFLKRLVDEGKLSLKGGAGKKIAYHDPCYLGRHNDIFDVPRELIAAVGGELTELAQKGKFSLCCGGGGGRLWMETPPEQRFSDTRVRQAVEAGAEVLATACPYCISLLEDSVKTTGNDDKLQIKDLSELVLGDL
jgi:Fe-S oxidoreductase